MKQISGSHHCISSQIRLNTLCEMLYVKCRLAFCLVLRPVNVERIYGSIPKDLKFDWSIQFTWKRRALVNYVCLSIFSGVAARKLTNTPAVIFSYLCRNRWFIFTKQVIVLLWVIVYSYLQRFFKTGVLKMLYTIERKRTVWYCETVKNTIFTRTPWDSLFCIYGRYL